MRPPARGQTRIVATAPLADVARFDGGPPSTVTRHLVVDSRAFRLAEARAVEDLQTLLSAAIVRAGGDPDRIVWSAEAIGPQIELATVNGRRL